MRAATALSLIALLLIDPRVGGGLLHADEVQSLTAVADAPISQAAPTTNNGLSDDEVTSETPSKNLRSLFQFDLSSIAATAAVKTSRLKLFLRSQPPDSRTHGVRRVTGSPQWTETGVTWNSRDGATNWTAPGGDFVSTATDTQVTGTVAGVTITFTVRTDGVVSNIPQGWLDGSVPNRGVIIKDESENAAVRERARYSSRERGAPEQPILDVSFLRSVTLGAPTAGISEVTHSWTFPAGSTSSNYNGVLLSKLQGSTAPSNTPSDGITYVVGDTVAGSETVGINTSSFATTSATNENGANSVVLPGTTYTYTAFTHDNTTITGAASTAAPHYSKGVASSSVTTLTGGGTSKNWSYLTGAATLAAPGLDPGSVVVTGSNDSKVHSMSSTNGGRNYQPAGAIGTTSGAIQSRPPVIAASDTTHPTCAGVCDVVYVGAGDGKVYAFRTDTGQQLWVSSLLSNAGGQIQGAPAVQVKAFSNAGYTLAFDLVVVGTRNLTDTTGNKIYGLNGNTGAIVWTFAPGNLDIINSTPMVDLANNFVWVTSRAGGGAQPSIRSLSTINGAQQASITLTTTNKDIDASPSLNDDGSFLYALTNGGDLVAVQTSNNSVFSTNVGAGSGVGFPLPVRVVGSDEIYFSSTVGGGRVHKRIFDRTLHTYISVWDTPLASASTPIITFAPLTLAVYAGSSDGKLHKLDATIGTDLAQRTVNLAATVGDPSLDTVSSKFYVGDSSGRIYSFDVF